LSLIVGCPVMLHQRAMRDARMTVLAGLKTIKAPPEDADQVQTFDINNAWFGIVRFEDGDWTAVGHYCRHKNGWLFDSDVTFLKRSDGRIYELPYQHYCKRDLFDLTLRYGCWDDSVEVTWTNWSDFVLRQYGGVSEVYQGNAKSSEQGVGR
jgi:hypothetical protein